MSSVVTPLQTSPSTSSIDVHDAVLHRLEEVGTCLFNDLVDALGEYAWNEVFLAVDEMTRKGKKEISEMFARAHDVGLATVLWCYLRNNAFKKDADYHLSADLTGQANHLGVTIEADIIKQKLPENNGGYKALNIGSSGYGKFDERIYSELASEHPIDLCRYQVANCYMGRAGLINSGGAAGKNDLHDAVVTAVINKRAGGMGLISGRKAFQRPIKEGVALLKAVQDVYLCKEVTVA